MPYDQDDAIDIGVYRLSCGRPRRTILSCSTGPDWGSDDNYIGEFPDAQAERILRLVREAYRRGLERSKDNASL